MRFSTTTLLAAAAAAPALVAAEGRMGFALGTQNADGSCKDQPAYESDFDAILANTDATPIVRGYSASDCNMAAAILPAAAARGFQVILGIWPDTDASLAADLAAIEAVVTDWSDAIYAVTVGSETLYRGNFTGPELADKITFVKNALPGVAVGTADSYNRFTDGTADAVIPVADILLANAFAYWQGYDISNATNTYFDDMQLALTHIQDLGFTGEIWNGETGWPTDPAVYYEEAIGGIDNAATFFAEAVCAFRNLGGDIFYFEAFDEPSKAAATGDDGTSSSEASWGAFTVDRVPKFDLHCS